MKMQLSEIARALNQETIPDAWQELMVTGVEFDSRQMQAGSLFVPLQGERDGHDFIDSAIEHGAVATLWASSKADQRPDNLPTILVDDPLTAVQDLARHFLIKINPKVVAITGSNGKTTTKDMTAAVLSTQYNVVKTKANFNNEIGVPFTILGMDSNTEILVVELGMDRPGQLEFLSDLVQPDQAVITMIGEAHIEFFKTRAKIADAKMEITSGLKEDGLFIFNGDEPLLNERATEVEVEQCRFGLNDGNDIQAFDIAGTDRTTSFKTNLDDQVEFVLPIIGEYNVYNALAALAVGKKYHIKNNEAKAALAEFNQTKNRTEWVSAANGAQVLSDVYNSNPTAAKAVLESFAKTQKMHERYVVLGDMLELGPKAPEMHAQLADSLDPDQFAEVYLVGSLMKALRDRLVDENIYNKKAVHYYDANQLDVLVEDLKNKLTNEDTILLKASHGIHLEKVVEKLQQK